MSRSVVFASGAPGARLLRPVDVVGEEVGHRAERRGDGGADPVHLRPEVRHREPPVDRGPAAVDSEPEHRRDDGVEVEHRQRRPHHVVGGAPPADADLARQRAVVGVAEHAALREAGGAAGVDEGGEVARADVGEGLRLGGEQLLPAVHRRPDLRLGVAQHHHVLERWDLVDDALGPVGEVGLDQEHARPGVGQLMAEVLALVGGVDGDGDTAAGDDPPPGQHGLVRVLDERGDAVAPFDPEAGERRGDAARGVGDVGRRGLDPAHVEVLAVGIGLQPTGEQLGDGVLLALDPHLRAHGRRTIGLVPRHESTTSESCRSGVMVV